MTLVGTNIDKASKKGTELSPASVEVKLHPVHIQYYF